MKRMRKKYIFVEVKNVRSRDQDSIRLLMWFKFTVAVNVILNLSKVYIIKKI